MRIHRILFTLLRPSSRGRLKRGRRNVPLNVASFALGALLLTSGWSIGTPLENLAPWASYESHDIFALERALGTGTNVRGERLLFLHAVLLSAFGHDAQSASLLRRLPPATDANLVCLVHTLLMLDERGLYHYRPALESLLSLRPRDRTAETGNQIRLLQAISDVPEQQIEQGPPLSLRKPEVAARVGSGVLPLLVDTSASFSALTRSSARKVGLAIRPMGYAIDTALGERIRADVAEGELELAGIRLRHVIFLVIPDASLGSGSRFGGIVGTPVLRAIGRIDFGNTHGGARGYASPLAFVDGHPVVEATLDGKVVTCTLDTGATRSSISASLWQGAAARSGPARRLVIVRTAAGTHAMPMNETTLPISIAGRTASLSRAMILRGMDGAGSTPCKLGYDAVAAFEPLTFDFVGMRLVLR